VAALWKAQNDLVQMRIDDVKKTLDSYPQPSNVPLVELLRARLALVQSDSYKAGLAYQNAINIGPGRDGLWIEAAEASFSGGYEDQGKLMLHRAADIGSRNAGIYYGAAAEDLSQDHLADADARFRQAWTMLPLQRRTLVGSGLLSMIARQKDNAVVSLSTPEEATFAAPDVSTRAIAVPPAAIARVSGRMFKLDVGDASLIVPGGASLAPANATVVDAGAWERITEEQALANVAGLIKDAAAPGTYAQPVMRGRITRAAQALATRNRWAEVAALTSGINLKWQFIDTGVVLLRADALRHLSREAEGKQVVLDVAVSPAVGRRNSAAIYEQVGEALASFDEFDAAINMYSKAKTIQAGNPFDTMRIEQVAMSRGLARRYRVYESPHFHVHYPGGDVIVNAVAIAKILEAELTRLQQWVPVPNFRPVVVNIVPWTEFRTTYSQGNDILGFYDRAITVPLAEIEQLEPEVTAIVTHELTHALIAQATHDQAPHWFHEGLAQRMEMVPYSRNAFNMYDDSKLFAISVLDPILTRAQDGGMIGGAYVVSQTFIRYLQSTYGDRAIKQMLASFAAGATSDEALQQLSGTTSATVDANFRKWGRSESRVFQNPAPILYELSGDKLIQLSEPAEPPKRLQGGSLRRGRRN
ncbi:MAG: peptidase MA family metallohydrolase, partial [Thermoanaerobaculia bacterium]